MATSVYLFTDPQKKLRWEERYVSEGINKKLTAESHGIVRGFELAAQSPASKTQFRLLVDPVKLDSVICLRNADNRIMTLIVDGPITIDMSALAPGQYWIVAWTDYSIGALTDARIYILTTAELSNPTYSGRIAVIGWVNYSGATDIDPNPAGTPNLGVSDYSLTTGGSPAAVRQIARNYESKGRIDWQKMIRFGRADEYMGLHALGNKLVEEWKQSSPAFLDVLPQDNGYMTVDDVDPAPPSGDLHFVVNAKSDTAGVPTTLVLSHKMLTHVKGGDVIRFSFQYKVPVALGGGGNWTLGYGIMYLDKDGNIVPAPGAVSALLAIGVGGAATAWTKLENEVHVIDGRNIVYALPILTIIHTDNTGANVYFYFDDFEMEVLEGRGPQLDPSVDANEHVMQPVSASVLRIRDWAWDVFPNPTQVQIIDWELVAGTILPAAGVAGGGRSIVVRRKNGPAVAPHPLFEMEGDIGVKAGVGPVGNTRHRQALFEQNTPRAWATLQWNGVALVMTDSYGFDSVATIGAGHYRLTFDLDEDGNDWVQDSNYSVALGFSHGSVIPATGRMVHVVSKAPGPPATLDIAYRYDTGVAWNLNDPNIPGDEIYVQIFAAD